MALQEVPAQAGRVRVVVVAAAGGQKFWKEWLVPAGQTLGWCVNASGLLGVQPALRGAKMGVDGKILPPETVVQEGDRIEVYLPCESAALMAHRQRLSAAKARGKLDSPVAKD